jgi:hypothetical protein
MRSDGIILHETHEINMRLHGTIDMTPNINKQLKQISITSESHTESCWENLICFRIGPL